MQDRLQEVSSLSTSIPRSALVISHSRPSSSVWSTSSSSLAIGRYSEALDRAQSEVKFSAVLLGRHTSIVRACTRELVEGRSL